MRTPRRISKHLAFVPLQDASGVVQLTVQDETLVEVVTSLPTESVLCVHGEVHMRAENVRNATMATGDIEVLVTHVDVLNAADTTLPFYASQCRDDAPLPNEALRAKHRYLDLRRAALTAHIRRRSRVAHAARCYLHDRDFIEVETPTLLRSTPEGAREFLVPSRLSPGPQFYALQQSPQQPKQLLMVSGVTDKYFQLAKCFRDEDGRKDRQPEFTQLDLEMSFVSGHGDSAAWRIGGREVRDITEGVVRAMWDAAEQPPLPTRFPVYSYEYVMQTYGSDKPDLRFGLRLRPLATPCGTQALGVLVLPRTPTKKLSAKQLAALLHDAHGTRVDVEHFKAKRSSPDALAQLLMTKSRHVAALSTPLPQDAVAAHVAAAMRDASLYEAGREASYDDACDVFVARHALPMDGGSTALGDLRVRLGEALALHSATPQVLWVTEFPLFTLADADKAFMAQGRWCSTHHPFTAPAAADVDALWAALDAPRAERDARLARIHGQHYDLVLNGAEIGGGSVRVHDPHLQRAIFREVLELSEDEEARFAHLLHALHSGAPPHAGLAIGFDRFMAMACNTSSIRDVMAFPKSGAGTDPLFQSPSLLEDSMNETAAAALRPYHLQARRDTCS